MIVAQVALELREMMLRVLIAHSLFFVISREIGGSWQIVLNAPPNSGRDQNPVPCNSQPAPVNMQSSTVLVTGIIRENIASILILPTFDSEAPLTVA